MTLLLSHLPPQLVVFDVDGTLHDTFRWWAPVIRAGLQRFAALHELDVAMPSDDEAEAVVGMRDAGVWAPFLPEPHKHRWQELRAVVLPMEPDHLQVTLFSPSQPVDDLIPIGLRNRPELASHQAVVLATLERLRQERLRPLIPSILITGNGTPDFLYQGGIIGVFGTAFGLILGVVVCKLLLVYALPLDPKVYFISHLPVQVRPIEFVLVGVFAIIVCLLATVWPALHAARLRPAEAFRDQG